MPAASGSPSCSSSASCSTAGGTGASSCCWRSAPSPTSSSPAGSPGAARRRRCKWAARRGRGRQPRPARVLQVLRASSSTRSAPAGTARAGADRPLLVIILPVGISFFTFRAMSYVIDVYRGELEPAVAARLRASTSPSSRTWSPGPIVRASEFLPQLAGPAAIRGSIDTARRSSSSSAACSRRCVIANYLAPHIVDPVFDDPGSTRAWSVLVRHRRLRGADLLRLLRLHRHRDRHRAAARASSCPTTSTRPTVASHPGVLAALAHDAVPLAARLPVHPARRQPRRSAPT